MLTIFFGVSCVGKSTLMQELRSQFGWLTIPTYVTRPLRFGETEKISISHADFLEMEDREVFLCVNQIYGNRYGIPRAEVEFAIQNRDRYWVLDFPISKKYLLDGYHYSGFVILPQDETQLVQQAKIAGRIDRLSTILEEYRKRYVGYHNQRNNNEQCIPIVNLPHSTHQTSRLIHSLVVGVRV